MQLKCHSGVAEVEIGTRFTDEGIDWEVVSFPGSASYSPSNLGGAPNVLCKPLSPVSDRWRKYLDADGNCEWCGDSVAAKLLSREDGKKRSARGDLLTK